MIFLTGYKDSKIYQFLAKFCIASISGSLPVKILKEGIAWFKSQCIPLM